MVGAAGGGGLRHPESIYDYARRETFEETGLSVELGNIAYVRLGVRWEEQ